MSGVEDDDDALDASDAALLREAARAPARTPKAADTSLIGRRLGKYEIAEILGRGGMGVVYIARDTALDRRVALKVMGAESLGDQERRRRFLREAKSAAAVTGANIAAIYDVGVESDIAWFAMELVEGQTLRARLAEGPLEVAEAIRVARGIARGLVRAHAVGIIHRDLKPDNVMFDVHSEPKVLDFGLAKRRDAAGASTGMTTPSAVASGSTELRTEEGRLLGTPAYMSPEQAKGHAITPRSDVFSLGTMLYEMLTGERPFRGTTTMETLIAIDRDEVPAPSMANPAVPSELDALVARCLAKKPVQRPESSELESELGKMMDPASSSRTSTRDPARPAADSVRSESEPTPSGVENLTEPRERHRISRTTTLGVAGALAIVVLTTLLVARGRLSSSAAIDAGPAVSLPSDDTRSSAADTPAPASSVPAALEAFRASIAAKRDGSAISPALLERAVSLDPDFTAARLELAIYLLTNDGVTTTAREHFRAARAHPERLTLLERDLAEACEPLALRDPGDWKETNRRMTVLKGRYPNDLRIARLWAASEGMNDARKGPAAWAEVVAAHPDALGPRATYGENLAYAGRYDESRATLDACIAQSSQAATCVWFRMKLARFEGDCARMEELARQLVVVEPAWDQSYEQLAESLAGRHPTSAVRAVLAQRWSNVDASARAAVQAADAADADALDGDFASALRHAGELETLVQADRVRRTHARAARRKALLLLEVGRTNEARIVAKEFLDRRQAWEADTLVEDFRVAQDATPLLVAVAALPEKASSVAVLDAASIRERDAWETIAHRQVSAGLGAHVWLAARAFPAWILGSPAEAKDAIAALARVERPPPFMPDSLGMLPIGAAYLRSDRADEAMPWLERATKSCRALGNPIEHTRAFDLLGQALETKSDKAGACTAYAKVIERWGRAPSSVTAAHARSRLRMLDCEKK